MFLEYGVPDVAGESRLVDEPADEAVSVEAVEEDAGAVVLRVLVLATGIQQGQVAARLSAAEPHAVLRGEHRYGAQEDRARSHCVLCIQHEAVLTGKEAATAVRRLLRVCRRGVPQEESGLKEKQSEKRADG